MPLFEIRAVRNSIVYYEVEARDRAQALGKYTRDEPVSEVIESERLYSVTAIADDDIDDDDEGMTDEYEEEQFDYDE